LAVDHAIGIDIGGTTTVGAVISRDGRVIARKEMATNSTKGSADGLRRLGKLVNSLLKDSALTTNEIAGIGIGATGPINASKGTIENPFSLPGWEGIPVVNSMREQFGLPTCLLGDCQIAALGEYWMGAGQGARHLFYMTVGTGIGGAFIFNGNLYRGLSDNNEVGYQMLDFDGPECGDGTRGCFEALASGPAIARMAAEAPAKSKLIALAGGDTSKLDAKLVVKAAQDGDKFSIALVQRVGEYLGHGIANIINTLSPDRVVLGGGVMLSWNAFAPHALAVIEKRCQVIPIKQVTIAPARLGLNAGVTGAARALWMHLAGML
jgi:glucokinase